MDEKKKPVAFTLEERKEIEHLLKEGWSCYRVAKKLNRAVSVLYREVVERGGGSRNYDAEVVHSKFKYTISENGGVIKKRTCTPLNLGERIKIEEGLKKGDTIMEICRMLNRRVRTVEYEIYKNGRESYNGRASYELLSANQRKKIQLLNADDLENQQKAQEILQNTNMGLISLDKRVEILEIHTKILLETIKELKNGNT